MFAERLFTPLKHLAFAFVLLLVFSSAAWAAGGGGVAAPPEYREAEKAIKAGDFATAVPLLEKLVQQNPKDANSLNYLGYSYRNLGNLELSEDYYLKALAADPKHRGAYEYLGELYLQTDRPEKAREMLAHLDDLCFWGCDEYDELKEAIEQYAMKASS